MATPKLRPTRRTLEMTQLEQAGVTRTILGSPTEREDAPPLIRTPRIMVDVRVHEKRPRVSVFYVALRAQTERDRKDETIPAQALGIGYKMEMN